MFILTLADIVFLILVCSRDRKYHSPAEGDDGEVGRQGFETKYANRDDDGKTLGRLTVGRITQIRTHTLDF